MMNQRKSRGEKYQNSYLADIDNTAVKRTDRNEKKRSYANILFRKGCQLMNTLFNHESSYILNYF